MEKEIFEVIISELDYYLIEKVRALRIQHKPYLSMFQLSLNIDLPVSAVSKIENMKKRDRYNIRTLTRLAYVLGLDSYADLLPEKVLPNDMVRITLRKRLIKNGKQAVKIDGSVDKAYEVLSIKPLSEKELELWRAGKLPYLTIIK